MKRAAVLILFLVAAHFALAATPMKPFVLMSRVSSGSAVYIQATKIIGLAPNYPGGTGVWIEGTPLTSAPTLIVIDTPTSIIAAALVAES